MKKLSKKPNSQDAARDSHAPGRPVRQPARDRVLAQGEGCVSRPLLVKRRGAEGATGRAEALMIGGARTSSFFLLRRRPSDDFLFASLIRSRSSLAHSLSTSRPKQLCDEHGIGPDGQLLDPEVVRDIFPSFSRRNRRRRAHRRQSMLSFLLSFSFSLDGALSLHPPSRALLPTRVQRRRRESSIRRVELAVERHNRARKGDAFHSPTVAERDPSPSSLSFSFLSLTPSTTTLPPPPKKKKGDPRPQGHLLQPVRGGPLRPAGAPRRPRAARRRGRAVRPGRRPPLLRRLAAVRQPRGRRGREQLGLGVLAGGAGLRGPPRDARP